MLASMPRAILILLLALAWPVATCARAAEAPRVAQVRIAKLTTAVATLHDVRVRLAWRAGAPQGDLQVEVGAVDAPDLGYRYRDLRWQCPLSRANRASGGGGASNASGWRCEGAVRSGRARPLRLAITLDDAMTFAALRDGRSALTVSRRASTPDDTAVDLARVPLAWAQALLAQAWPDGQLKGGTLDGHLRVHAPDKKPLQVEGMLALAGAALDTPDASIAAQDLGATLDIDYRTFDGGTPHGLSTVKLDGELRGGELLFGSAYVALPSSPIGLHVDARRQGDAGWTLPAFEWRDGTALHATGGAAFAPDASLQSLDVAVHAADLAPWRERYLSGWLGLAGLSDLALAGGLDAQLHVDGGVLQAAGATLHGVDLADGKDRFRFDGLDGDVRFSAAGPVDSELRWREGKLYGLDFAAATLPMRSAGGELRLREPVTVPAFGGTLRFDGLVMRPPANGQGMRMDFALDLDRLDIGAIAQALGLPAFDGELSGTIPNAHYADERMAFDGGLDMQLFGGTVRVSQLTLERPFGVAPSLGADLAIDDLDLHALTGVFDFGSIDGKLDGRIDGLRLVDWGATAFDAELHTDAAAAKRAGVRQRISQRAVQDISSVGDASFVASLQGRLLALFDDFGYARIGISCRLANEVCLMDGLHAAGRAPDPAAAAAAGATPDTARSSPGFTIVEGSGLPRLSVVGFNRLVDWPTLLERLTAAGKGDVSPVVQ
jgi:hypothetical protein